MLQPPSLERVIEVSPESVSTYPMRAPLLQAVAVQCGAFLLILTLTVLTPGAAGDGDAMLWALAQGIVAAALGRAWGMEIWWFPINLLFVPALIWVLGFDLSPLYALGAFFLLTSVYWGVSNTRVPLFLSSRAALRAVANQLPQERDFSFVDLGCGLGGVLSYLVRARPEGRYHGIEAAPFPFLLSRLRAALGGGVCRVTWGDFRNLDLGQYDVVYAYLSPAAMTGLWEKARREMRLGSLLISNSFAVPGVLPAQTVVADGPGNTKLLLWRM